MGYEMVDHPSHYNKYDVEVVDMIKRIWGPFIVSKWCEINAFKYRMRLGEKPDNPIQQDLDKENFYLDKYRQYKAEWDDGVDFDRLTKEEQDYINSFLPVKEERKSNTIPLYNDVNKKNLLTD